MTNKCSHCGLYNNIHKLDCVNYYLEEYTNNDAYIPKEKIRKKVKKFKKDKDELN
jgi:hypothetical protein